MVEGLDCLLVMDVVGVGVLGGVVRGEVVVVVEVVVEVVLVVVLVDCEAECCWRRRSFLIFGIVVMRWRGRERRMYSWESLAGSL